MEEKLTNRIGVVDKREIFQTLIASVDRLFFLNMFPVDMEDFALSLLDPEVEDAWRLLVEINDNATNPSDTFQFRAARNIQKDYVVVLHKYPVQKGAISSKRIFMPSCSNYKHLLSGARRHKKAVMEWVTRQVRLEDQILRADAVIKEIVTSCNTVGQYREVSPELITFLPEKYKLALSNYTKRSPYPEIAVEKDEIETTLSTLAYAALQPQHLDEERYLSSKGGWYRRYYELDAFPRQKQFNYYDQRRVDF